MAFWDESERVLAVALMRYASDGLLMNGKEKKDAVKLKESNEK